MSSSTLRLPRSQPLRVRSEIGAAARLHLGGVGVMIGQQHRCDGCRHRLGSLDDDQMI